MNTLIKYKSINDSPIEALQSGNIEIYYWKNIEIMSSVMYNKNLKRPNLKRDYVLLGKIKARDLETIFEVLQAEIWSRNGEANDLVRSLGLKHSSMSVGDVVMIHPYIYLCMGEGWRKFKVKK